MPERTELRTGRLLLRPLQLTDVNAVYAYAKDPLWGRFLQLPKPYEFRHAEEYVARAVLNSWDTNPTFAITLHGEVIGTIGLRLNLGDGTAELGYSIARGHWGKGLMPEAAGAVIDWSFRDLGLARVTARAVLTNSRSWRVMEKLGMQREGILRSAVPNSEGHDRRDDMVAYSILREEWEGLDSRTVAGQ